MVRTIRARQDVAVKVVTRLLASPRRRPPSASKDVGCGTPFSGGLHAASARYRSWCRLDHGIRLLSRCILCDPRSGCSRGHQPCPAHRPRETRSAHVAIGARVARPASAARSLPSTSCTRCGQHRDRSSCSVGSLDRHTLVHDAPPRGALRTWLAEDSMAIDKDRKRHIRERAAKTGERYTVARMHELAREVACPDVPQGRSSVGRAD
jgi:hypothetical protein